MSQYYFRHSIYILLLAGFLTNSCIGQESKGANEEKVNASKPIPKITGTPPPFSFQPGVVSDSGLVSQYIRSIFQDSKGNFWFGPAGQSVARYDEITLHYFSKSEFFYGNKNIEHEYGNSVHAISEDQKGNIWFGTDYGIIKYDGKNFRSYNEKNGLSDIKIGRKGILIDKAGSMWVGTGGGVFRYNPSADSADGKCFSLFDLLPQIIVTDIMEDKGGNIWFASRGNGVFRYGPSAALRASEKVIENITEIEGLGDNFAGGMIQDNAGNYWFTMKGGICRYDPSDSLRVDGKAFTDFITNDGLGGSEVCGIYMETSGIIWISARGSTTRYDPSISNSKAFTVFTEQDGINCCVQCMYQDRSGNMWWGAGAGLYRFDGKRFYQVKQSGPW